MQSHEYNAFFLFRFDFGYIYLKSKKKVLMTFAVRCKNYVSTRYFLLDEKI